MVNRQGPAHSVCRRLGWKLMTSAAIIALATGCSKTSRKDAPQNRLAAMGYSQQQKRSALEPNNPLHIATTKWARQNQKDPADVDAALNYARSLKALGAKDKALEVLARTHQIKPSNGELVSEYGRLALDLGKVQLAEQLLNKAMHARGTPDWRVLSAMGTVQAKHGNHAKAQSYYLAALKQQPGATSVYNNLALSYALDGKAGAAEDLLKQAVNKGHNTQVVRQNLALVLGLQSKFDEAQQIAQTDLDNSRIDNNVSYLRKMVKTNKIAKAPVSQQTRTANAAMPKAVRTATVDPVTTAAIPRKAATQTRAAPAALPTRKPKLPEATEMAIARTLTKEQKMEMARPLPWAAKTGKKEKTTAIAALQATPSTSQTATAGTGGSWSTSVTAPAAPGSDAPVTTSKKVFRFPETD